jgi:hypothetical protein
VSQFEEILRRSVVGLGESYRVAEADLYEETASASESVKNITEGLAHLVLQKSEDDAESTWVNLVVATQGEFYEIATFLLSPQGYPIKVGASQQTMSIMNKVEARLVNRDDIREYFTALASNNNSRLVLRVAYLMRTRGTATQDGSPS